MATSDAPARLHRKNSGLMFMADTPPHVWKEDPDFHYLCLTIPGFETKDITIHVDKYGYLVVRGEKQVTEHKYISFNETFELPNNSDIEESAGQFINDQIYRITIPKKRGKEGMIAGHKINMPKEKTVSSRSSIPKEEIDRLALAKKPSVNRARDNEVIGSSVHMYGSGKATEMQGMECNALRGILSEKCKKKNIISVGIFVLFIIIVVPLVVRFNH